MIARSSVTFFSRRFAHSGFVGCFALIYVPANFVPDLYFLMISRSPSPFKRYSSASVVRKVASTTTSSGRFVNTTSIEYSLAPTVISSLSIFTAPFPSLKNKSRASRIVDLPMSFRPTNTVRSLKSMTVRLRYPLKFVNTTFLIFISYLSFLQIVFG